MPTAPTIDEKVDALLLRSRENEKKLQILAIDNRKFAKALMSIKSRDEPILDENGHPQIDRYDHTLTEKKPPKNPLLGQPDLTDPVREKVCANAETGIIEIENILDPQTN